VTELFLQQQIINACPIRELWGQVLNLDIGRIENKQIRNVKNKDLTPFLAFTDRHHNVQKPLANLLEVSWKRHKDKISVRKR